MNWKEQLGNIKQKGDRQDDRLDPGKQKKKSRLMFRKRKLDKEIKKYINNAKHIRFEEIERIGQKHQFYTEGTLPRKDKESDENA